MGTSPSNKPGTLGHPVSLVPVVPRADLSKVGLVQYEWPVWSQRSRRYQLLISSVFGVHRLACGIRIELPRAAGNLVHGDIIMSCMSC